MMIAKTATATPNADAQKNAKSGKSEGKGASAFGALISKFTPPEKPQAKSGVEKQAAEKPETVSPVAETSTAETPAEATPASDGQAMAVPVTPVPTGGQLPPVLLAGLANAQPAPPMATSAAPPPEALALPTAASPATLRAQPLRGPKPAAPADPVSELAAPKPGETETPAIADFSAPIDPAIALAPGEAAPAILSHKAAETAPLPAATLTGDAVSAGGALAQQSLETRLDVARDAQWIDRAARDIAQMATGEGRLRFRLDPEQLGSLQIDLSNGADGVSLRMTAETEAARAILADAQPKLLAEARAQGVRIAESHVDLGNSTGGEGRNAPPPQTARPQDRIFGSEAAAEAVAAPTGERFA